MQPMKYDSDKAHYIVVTAIIVKRKKFLVTKRASTEKTFPDKWTVPGGKLEMSDYKNRTGDLQEKTYKKKTSQLWYNILENVLKREILEETNLKIKNVRYVTSLVYIRPDKIPTLIISLMADYKSGKVKLPTEMSDYDWVNIKEARKIDLIGGIYEELVMADRVLRGKSIGEWSNKKT
jgi:8-oxo-dGTP pyrophosphatase MutT (NUDIX family)